MSPIFYELSAFLSGMESISVYQELETVSGNKNHEASNEKLLNWLQKDDSI